MTVPIIRTRGTQFVDQQTGDPWKWRGVSAFRLFYQYLIDAPIDTYCAWAAEHGINLLRVYSLYCGRLGRLLPRDHPAYLPMLDGFLSEVARYGLSVELVAFADLTSAELYLLDPLAHYHDLADVLLGRPGVTLEIAGDATIDPRRVYTRFLDLCQAFGCGQGGGPYVTMRGSREPDWASAPLPVHPWPVVYDRPMGIGHDDLGRRSLNPHDHAAFHARAIHAAGATIHGDFGIEGRLPTDAEQVVVEAIVEAWDRSLEDGDAEDG